MPKREPILLDRFYNESNLYEFALDEAGRGCLFGRVYIACVVLPKDPAVFSGVDGTNIKDSKKFSSKKKLGEVAEYIKRNALAWHISWMDECEIDKVNILKATMKGMHSCIDQIFADLNDCADLNHRRFEMGHSVSPISNFDVDPSEDVIPLQIFKGINKCLATVDGNYFTPYRRFDLSSNTICELPHITIEKGDGKYMGIAAASILAKNARDQYVTDLCEKYPELVERYGLDTNMGYGTQRHMDGIREHGISQWHRKTFGPLCKNADTNIIILREPRFPCDPSFLKI